MAAPLVFRREWIVEIKEMFHDDDHDNFLPSTAAILHVPTPLLNMKPEAYIPQLISLGPYHHSKLDKDVDFPCAECKISMAERYKVRSAVTLSWNLRNCGKNFKFIVEIMNRMRPEIESFYGLPTSTEGEYSQNFALMMAIDSSFLLQFFSLFDAHGSSISTLSLDREMEKFFETYGMIIALDIIRMENQIPLFVLKRVLQDVIEDSVHNESLSFNHLLPFICQQLSPFKYDILCLAENERNRLIDSMAKEPHFLGCLHRSLSQFLEMPSGDERQRKRMGIRWHKFNDIFNKPVIWIRCHLPTVPGLEILLQKLNDILINLLEWISGLLPAVPDTAVRFSKGMSAGQLATAGIQFKRFTKLPDYIRLDKDSGTLYLPQICVSDFRTEVFLRNMLALEFNDDPRPKYVTNYVDLMDHLIQSPDDVRILLDAQVISGGLLNLTDERMVQMWYDVSQPFFRGSWTQIHGELYDAFQKWFKRSYWKNNIKRKFSEFYNFVLSWKFAGPVAAFLGLLMTAIQTYCSLYHCTR